MRKVLQDRIQQLCKEKNISYYTLAYKSSIPMSTLINIIEGTSKNPGIFTIMKICDGLEVSMKEFFDTKEFENAIEELRDES